MRINDRSSAFWENDVASLRGMPTLAGVMLAKAKAKAEAPEHVTETFGSGDYRRDAGTSAEDGAMAYPAMDETSRSRSGTP